MNEWTIGSQTSEGMDIQQRNKRQMSKRESSEWLNRAEEKSKGNDYYYKSRNHSIEGTQFIEQRMRE